MLVSAYGSECTWSHTKALLEPGYHFDTSLLNYAVKSFSAYTTYLRLPRTTREDSEIVPATLKGE